jgi:hypothetical protein
MEEGAGVPAGSELADGGEARCRRLEEVVDEDEPPAAPERARRVREKRAGSRA